MRHEAMPSGDGVATREPEPDAGPGCAWTARLARDLHRHHASLDDTLHAVTAAALLEVPGVTSAGVSLVTGRDRLEPQALTDPTLDRLIPVLLEPDGPGPEVAWRRPCVLVDDLATEERWPQFTAAGRAAGIAAFLSVRLWTGDETLGSLDLYATEPGALDARSEAYAHTVAAHAAVALASARHAQQLLAALRSRDVISVAKGRLMEQLGITAEDAFLLLVQWSQRSNTKLARVAEQVALSRSDHLQPQP